MKNKVHCGNRDWNIACFGLYEVSMESGASDLMVLSGILQRLIEYMLLVIGALGKDTIIWCNPVSHFISRVNMEIYMAHMLIFRIIEELDLTTIAGDSGAPTSSSGS